MEMIKFILKCDFIDGSIVNGRRQSFLYSFESDKKSRQQNFPTCYTEEKTQLTTLSMIFFYSKDDEGFRFDCNGETVTFTKKEDKMKIDKTCVIK